MLWIIWTLFILFVLFMLALDLGVFNRKAHVISIRESLGWTSFWIFLALMFNVLVYFMYEHHWLGIGQHTNPADWMNGKEAATVFFTGYIIEKCLSLDNIFVIALVFSYFGVERKYQHRVLFWGILGALLMRGIMIGLGAALIANFEWIIYVFAAILLFTAIKMMLASDEKVEPERNPLVKLARKCFRVTPTFEGEHFFSKVDGKFAITPMFLVLLVVESTDVIFAVDSIPAIFGITKDPFIVFTSNVFAILGLRSLYFALAGILAMFRYVKHSLIFVLVYVAVKMMIHEKVHIPEWVSLLIIALMLAVGMIASVIAARREGIRLSDALADAESGSFEDTADSTAAVDSQAARLHRQPEDKQASDGSHI